MAKKNAKNACLNDPFKQEILALADEIVDKYQIVLDFEDGEFYGRGLEMPNVYGEGKTANTCVKNTREALSAAVATMIERDETPPLPASDNARSEQVNIRLTIIEKDVLKALAKAHGFRGLGDFIRTRALAIS
jgi:predicted RNase H-like HicB family nuclease